MYNHIFHLHSSINGHLDCFCVLPIITKAAVSTCVQISLQDPAFNSLEHISRIQHHSVILFLIFWNTSLLFSTAAVLFYLPTNSARGFWFLHIIPITFCFLGFFSVAILMDVRWYLIVVLIVCVCVCLVAQLYLILCDPMDCILPGSSVPGIFQARILEWVDGFYSRGSFQPGIEPTSPVSPALAGRFFTTELPEAHFPND